MTRKPLTQSPPSSAELDLHWTDRALLDLLEIETYIARDKPTAAESWVDKLMARAEKAAKQPLAGRVVPEFSRADVREVLLRSYRIVYRILSNRIDVLTVFEGHRLLPPDLITGEDPA